MHLSTCLPTIKIWSNRKVEKLEQKILQSDQMMDGYRRRLESFERPKTVPKKRKTNPPTSPELDYWITTFGLPT